MLSTKHRRLAADIVEGMRARLRDETHAHRESCPFNDSNFDRPRRDAWREGWDFATQRPEQAGQIIGALIRTGGSL